jgi:hypothetical protein
MLEVFHHAGLVFCLFKYTIENILVVSNELTFKILTNYIHANALVSVGYYHHCHSNAYLSFKIQFVISLGKFSP